MSARFETLDRVFHLRRPAPLAQGVVSGIVAAFDSFAVLLAAVFVHYFYFAVRGESATPPWGVIGLALVLLLLTFHAGGLYRFTAVVQPRSHLKRVLVLGGGVGLAMLGLAFTLHVSAQFSRIWFFSWLAAAIVFLIGLRFLIAYSLTILARAGRIGRNIVIYGAGPQGERLIQRIKAMDEPWNRIVGVFDDRTTVVDSAQGRVGSEVCGYPVLGNLTDLLRWGLSGRPDEILIALPWSAEDRILQLLHRLAVLPANVRLASEFHRLDMIQGRTNSQFGLPMLNAYEKPVDGWGRIWKRLFDFALAGIAIVAAAPILLIVAALIRLESPGPVLFLQPRLGFNNKLINVYKFRTMRVEDSDTQGIQLTQRDDRRVTAIGAVLRRFSIDELPQLLNVLLGEMSLVGPRPHAIRTTAGGKECDQVVDQYAVRHKVKPGITGWAQVNGWRGTMETEAHLVKRLEHDLYYINNWSPLFDIRILLLTVWTVLQGKNSY